MIKNKEYFKLQASAKRELVLQKFIELMAEKEKSPTFEDIAKEFGVSKQRIKQIMSFWQEKNLIMLVKDLEKEYPRNSLVLTPQGIKWYTNLILDNNL
jgi:DNA-directed RNA polymerase specialized sigma subunit